MRRFLTFVTICSVLFGFISACDDDSVNPVPLKPPRFEDYVNFRDIGLTKVSRVHHRIRATLEDYVDCEWVMGEPFTDVDSDGVYDPYIDIFIITSNPDSNQDLNRDGMYNGPGSMWTPGIPFDDIDGDGFYDCSTRDGIDFYVPGLPFCDFNLNGRRDSLPHRWSFVTETRLTKETDISARYDFIQVDSAYLFISDSDVSYFVPPPNAYEPVTSHLRFVVRSDSGLFYSDLAWDVPVLDTGRITPGIIQFVFGVILTDTFTIRREIKLVQSAELDGRIFHDLVTIRVDSLMRGNLPYNSALEQLFYEWIFQRNTGLVGLRFKVLNSDSIIEMWTYDRIDSIPLPMTRASAAH